MVEHLKVISKEIKLAYEYSGQIEDLEAFIYECAPDVFLVDPDKEVRDCKTGDISIIACITPVGGEGQMLVSKGMFVIFDAKGPSLQALDKERFERFYHDVTEDTVEQEAADGDAEEPTDEDEVIAD